MLLKDMTKEELEAFLSENKARLEEFKAKKLSLNMARGKPSTEQLDLAVKMLASVNSFDADYSASDGTDCRNYGGLEGICDAKELFQPTK